MAKLQKNVKSSARVITDGEHKTTNDRNSDSVTEWVEIIEPRTKERMYANLITGKCLWDPPPNVYIKKTNENQWWELFDSNTSRFYYYNANSQKTVWHRPQNCDIIPLAKLQTLKQNTEVNDDGDIKSSIKRGSIGTQTPSRTPASFRLQSKTESGNFKTVSTETQTSPISSPHVSRKHRHHHHHSSCSRHHHASDKEKENRRRRSSNESPSVWNARTTKSQDSGRSSDSGSISQSRTSLEGKVRNVEAKERYKQASHHQSTETCDLLSPKSDLMTQVLMPLQSKQRSSKCDRSQSSKNIHKSSPDGATFLSGIKGHSASHYDFSSKQRNQDSVVPKQRSFDLHGYSRLRTGDNDRPREPFLSRSYSFMQRRERYNKDDAMHEKYLVPGLRSVESTPQPRRKMKDAFQDHIFPFQIRSTESSSSGGVDSLCTPMMNRKPLVEPVRAEYRSPVSVQDSLDSDSSSSPCSPKPNPQGGLFNSRFSNLESPVSTESPSGRFIHRGSSDCSQADLGHYSNTTDSRGSVDSIQKLKLKMSESMNRSIRSNQKDHTSTNTKKKNKSNENGGVESHIYSNTNMPFYFDPKEHPHLLPLQQYILEQAKLSGYRFGDPLADDRDSLHSDDDSADHRNDSDEFADDEGMSSQEYLDCSYLKEDENYAQFFIPSGQNCDPSEYDEPTTDFVDGASSYYPHISNHYEQYRSSKSLPSEAKHPSLPWRKNDALFQQIYTAGIDKSEVPPQSDTNYSSQRPLSLSIPITTACSNNGLNTQSGSGYTGQPSLSVSSAKIPSESDIEKYAQDNLSVHKKGFFRKNMSIQELLSWSKDPIRKPLNSLQDKILKKDACELFKLVQIYMGDRKAKQGMTLNSVAQEIAHFGWSKVPLRDEMYLQICKQTNDNPRKESLRRGWELLAICLAFFPPSDKFRAYLDSYINRHRDPTLDFPEINKWPIHVQISHYASVCCKRLQRTSEALQNSCHRKPTIETIEQARLQIFRPSMFGNTLSEIMDLQKERYPDRQLPWIQTTLSEEVLRLSGTQTEGIFRVPGDIDEVNALKIKVDQWTMCECTDAHVPASLLKLWYRELYVPLIPDNMYDACIENFDNPEICIKLVEKLPDINKQVLYYLIRFLQVFSKSECVQVTKMDANNLAMVMAPNCLRCKSDDPQTIIENARKEMAFVRNLIQNLDTSLIEAVI